MSGVFYLAFRHIAYHRLRSTTLVLVMTTLMAIPLLAEVLSRAAETRMMARAQATPLVYGAAGAPLDLTLAAAYFRGDIETPISMQDYDWLLATRQADLAPIHLAGAARGFPIIGTDIEYFRLRGLTPAVGRLPVRVGEVAIGAQVADALGITAGQEIVSDVSQVFDLAGAYPVGMTVSGVLAPTGTPDDNAVLTDLNTGWIVTGIGHGHQELTAQTDNALLLKSREDGTLTANASLPTYEKISAEQLADIHFHGDPAVFPLSAVIAFPFDEKATALLRGRVSDREAPVQIVRASDQIRGLMDNVFQVKLVLQRVMLVVSAAALLAIALIVWLSVQMRSQEFAIAQRLGAGRTLPALLVGGELLILFATALLLSLLIVWGTSLFEDRLGLFWFGR